MVGERHYDEETLLSFLAQDDPNAEHLSNCAECREKLDSFRLIAEALADEATWDETPISDTPNPDTIATLRTFADRMATEDAQAELYLQDLLDGTRDAWMSNLRHHPEYRTPGVVRKLIETIPSALDTMPRDAVELTALATEIADHLDPATSTPDTVSRLRGAAWRERAYALFYTGDYAAAERALCASESHFIESSVNEYDLARVGVVRALVERGLEKTESAISAARTSADVFAAFGDLSRIASARLAEAHLLFTLGDFGAAAAILGSLELQLQSSEVVDTHARVLGTLGFCCWKLGRIEEALHYHEAAAILLDELGVRTESVRVRWNVACILASEGRMVEAQSRFESVHAEFRLLGMTSAATLVTLDMAELLLANRKFEAVEKICRDAMRSFEAAGIPYTVRALTALSYMKEAARERTATPSLAKHVREYLTRLPHEANLLFAPPPE